jgi:LysR family transcriptional regulator, transcriptional activator of the cysJI operon
MADRRLQVFHTVARLLSFTKAAETLHMTQPAVTFQVKQLEDYYNTRLFDRTHNKISLTDAGRRIFTFAEKILEYYAEMDSAVRELTGEISGVLMIGASTSIAEYMLPPLLGAFKNKYPDVTVRLKVSNTDGIVSMVENNVIDLGIVEAPVFNKNLAVDLCRKDQLVLVVPPDHPITKKPTSLHQALKSYPFITREEGSGTRHVIITYLEECGINLTDLDLIMELGSPESIKGAVESNIGITIISESAIQKELKLGTLKAYPLDPVLQRPFSFVRQKQKFRQNAMNELLTFAQEYCSKFKK